MNEELDEEAVLDAASGSGYVLVQGFASPINSHSGNVYWFEHDTDPQPQFRDRRLAIEHMADRLGRHTRDW